MDEDMTRNVESAIKAMTDDELLSIMAFHVHDYEHVAMDAIQRELKSRGQDDNEIKSYRETHIPEEKAKGKCGNCKVELTFDKSDLVSAKYTCPACGEIQPIIYNSIKFVSPKNQLPDSSQISAVTDTLSELNKYKKIQGIQGLGGWLWLVGYGLVMGLLASIFELVSVLEGSDPLVISLTLFFVSFCVWILYLFFNRSRIFPTVAIILIWISPLFYFIELMSYNPSPNAFYSLVWYVIIAGIWTAYFNRSERVKNTFVVSNKKPDNEVGDEVSSSLEVTTVEPESSMSDSSEAGEVEPKLECSKCNTILDSQYEYCPTCGEEVVSLICLGCKRQVDRTASFCPYCGVGTG